MSSDRPGPLVPADVDCTDLDGFMLNVERLMASELVALSSHEVIGAAVMLWCRAWKQRPAASLPNDDQVISAFARMSLPRFKKLRDEVLRGFVLCSDGRLYHQTLSAEARKAYERKTHFKRKREVDAERLRKWRNTKDATQSETAVETRFVQEGQGQGQGQGHLKDKDNPLPLVEGSGAALRASPPTPPPAFDGTNAEILNCKSVVQIASAFTIPAQWGIDAEALGFKPSEVLREGEKFRQYWVDGRGKGTRRSVKGWRQSWSNWLEKAARNAR